jgi:hypothetical protein
VVSVWRVSRLGCILGQSVAVIGGRRPVCFGRPAIDGRMTPGEGFCPMAWASRVRERGAVRVAVTLGGNPVTLLGVDISRFRGLKDLLHPCSPGDQRGLASVEFGFSLGRVLLAILHVSLAHEDGDIGWRKGSSADFSDMVRVHPLEAQHSGSRPDAHPGLPIVPVTFPSREGSWVPKSALERLDG